jgi:hypothetical protein
VGVSIKERSPSRNTTFAAYEGPDVIYIAPQDAYRVPVSMEISNSPFGPQAASILIERTTEMLSELSRA